MGVMDSRDIVERLKTLRLLPALLSDRDLTRLNIKQTGLDLYTGKPGDGSERFTVPFPIGRIHEILDQSRPWTDYFLFSDNDWDTRRGNALKILYLLQGYLCHAVGREPPLIKETAWVAREVDYDAGEELARITRNGPNWIVSLLLEKKDKAPHVSCFLADSSLMEGHRLSNAEIWCILEITRHRLQRYDHSHRPIPVTVFSASNQELRIVQGYIDDQGCLRVRKSPILDFEGADIYYDTEKKVIVDNRDGLRLVDLALSWCIGDTVGSTEADDTQGSPAVGQLAVRPLAQRTRQRPDEGGTCAGIHAV
ncbi:hypothetical protein F4861DRAFT_540916 [Xylaria intraflava]|nr:hypothetical protein F4861DRAFT_540916 [Xylaria intraflava]